MRLFVVVAVFLSFAIDSFARYPVPGPNEPHYLCKAKHYWDPEWCRGDLFLSSANAHLVFFQTFGSLTRWFTLETTAIVGRLVGLLILAAGWTALVGVLVPGRWPALWAAWIFLALSALGNLSGEWLVGGIEAKVVAYGLLFGAIAAWIDGQAAGSHRRVLLAGVLAGIAISFHPVVGIWGVASAVFASLVRGSCARRETARRRVNGRGTRSSAAILAVLGAPGVIAGLRAAGSSSAVADYIQVYYRLAHHLDPMHFLKWSWIRGRIDRFSTIVGQKMIDVVVSAGSRMEFSPACGSSAGVGCRASSPNAGSCGSWSARRSSRRSVMLVGWRSGPPEHVQNYLLPWKWLGYPLRWKMLKLYPFRLFDAMLPIAVAITIAGLARRWCERACQVPSTPPRRTVPLIWFLCGMPALLACLSVASDARPQMTAARACRLAWTRAAGSKRTLRPTR